MKEKNELFTSFRDIYNAFKWKPIYGCPGRYILHEEQQYTLTEITGGRTDRMTFSTPKARDIVCVIILDDGGIISYKKEDGFFIHTLNNTSGFLKKLKMLDIAHQIIDGEGNNGRSNKTS